jgi:hypothetical protein
MMGIKQAGLAATAVAMLAMSVTAVAMPPLEPVLGNKAFAPRGGGFGTAHPKSFFNGDDQAGFVGHITWKNWGTSAVATGVGQNPIFKPTGGYYATPARIELRAYDLGTCPGSNRPAYRRLLFREPRVPGGRPGPWKSWVPHHTICTMP